MPSQIQLTLGTRIERLGIGKFARMQCRGETGFAKGVKTFQGRVRFTVQSTTESTSDLFANGFHIEFDHAALDGGGGWGSESVVWLLYYTRTIAGLVLCGRGFFRVVLDVSFYCCYLFRRLFLLVSGLLFL